MIFAVTDAQIKEYEDIGAKRERERILDSMKTILEKNNSDFNSSLLRQVYHSLANPKVQPS